jgi:hypothetical protein
MRFDGVAYTDLGGKEHEFEVQCIDYDAVADIQVVPAQRQALHKADIECIRNWQVKYDELKAENAELRRTLTEPVQVGVVAPELADDDEICIDSNREELTHALNWGYLVTCVQKAGPLSSISTGRIKAIVDDSDQYEGREYITFADGSSVFLDTITSVIIIYGDTPEEAICEEKSDPELADLLRAFVNGQSRQLAISSDMQDLIDASVRKLCELGVPNVCD